MKTKTYLGQAIRFDRIISNKLAEIDRCYSLATSIVVASKPDKIQTSSDKDKMGVMAGRIVDLENEVKAMENTRKRIITQIESLEDVDMYEVLYSKYVCDADLMSICPKLKCKKSKVYQIHNDAIHVFEEKYGSEYLNL